MDQTQADGVDIGIVELDDSGAIKIYNQYEADLAGLEKSSVLGKISSATWLLAQTIDFSLVDLSRGVDSGLWIMGSTTPSPTR